MPAMTRVLAIASLALFACEPASVAPAGQEGVTVSVEPSAAAVTPGGTASFTATVANTAIQSVTWSVQEGTAGGTVTSSGLYTAPTTAGAWHVVATSVADPSASGMATVTVTAPAAIAVSVAPSTAVVAPGGNVSFTATVANSANQSVTWSVQEGIAGGTVTGAGVYTAPSTAGTYHVVATSQADPTKSGAATVSVVVTSGPLRVLARNPRYFTQDDVTAVYLVGSHTWNNFQDIAQTRPPPPLDFDAYLSFLTAHRHSFFRLWKRELPTLCGWANGTWYVGQFPWPRTGPGNATDGLPKFDLARFEQSYFDRMRSRVVAAGQVGIYVSVMLFGGYDLQINRCSNDGYPLTGANNVNGIDDGYGGGSSGVVSTTLAVPAVTAVQDAYVRKVIDTVGDLDNVLYEVANEAGSYSTAWQTHVIDLIHAYEATKPKQHPVGFTFQYSGGSNATLFASDAEWISPDGSSGYGWPSSPPPATGQKVIVNDTDHSCYYTCLQGAGTAGQLEWTWKNFTSGNNLLFMDPYLIPWSSRNDPVGGNPDPAWDPFREALGETLAYARRVGLADMTPQPALCSTGYCLANVGVEYLVYQPSSGGFTVDLPAATYDLEWFNPATNAVAGSESISASGGSRAFTPPFSGASVLYLKAR